MQQGTQPTQNRGQIIAIIAVIVIAALVLIPRLFNNTTPTTTSTIPSVPQQQNPSTDNSTVQFGTLVASTGIDSNGCPTGTTTSFSSNNSIYVVAPNSTVAQGTTIYARLFRDNNAIEDTPEITSNQNYTNNCVNFVFQPTGAPFTAGSYTAQFFVNGNAGPTVSFNVQ